MSSKRDDKKAVKATITIPFRGSFVNLLKPRSFGGQDPKFSITMVLPEDHEFWDKMEELVEEACERRWDKVPPKLVHPIRHGSETEYDDWQDSRFCKFASADKPQVVDRDLEEITDRQEIYSGAWFRVAFRAYAWHYPDTNKKGVSLELDNVMKVRDDEPFAKRKNKAIDDFADYVDADDDDPEEDERPSRRRGRGGDRESRLRGRRHSSLD